MLQGLKICAKCRTPKPGGEYYADKRKPDGLMPSCRRCHHERTKAWRAKNPERSREIGREYRSANAEKYRDYARGARQRDPGRHRAASRKHAEANRERHQQRTREWFKNNPAKATAYVRARDAAKRRQALPCSREAIEAIYERARLLAEITGVPHHVDHIVPLKGRGVRGLHVPWNLQCLPADENRRKNNKL